MSTNRKNQISLAFLFSLSLFSFLYLNFYGVSIAETISSSDIATFQAVESTSFPEVKAVAAIFSRVIEIVTLK